MNDNQIKSMDSFMLLSIINMKLRDFYDDLKSLCDDLNMSQELIEEKMSKVGYRYHKEINQFIIDK